MKRNPAKPAKHVKVPFETHGGRSRPAAVEDRPDDKHGRSMMTAHSPQPDWGRATENKLKAKRSKNR